MRASVLAILAVAACGGKPATVTPAQPAAAADPPCPPEGKVELPADGTLRCRELPFVITFPANTRLARSNDHNLALFNAELEHGVLALLVEPRRDAPDATKLAELLANVAKGIAGDAVVTRTEPPALAGASIAVQLSFTTPDGGAGLVRGYFANHWLVAVAVGGRLATTATRPDSPTTKAFLASLTLRPLPTGMVQHALADGAHVAIPATAWSTGPLPREDGVRAEWLMMVPDRGVWIGVRELEPLDRCKELRESGDGLAISVQRMYGNADVPLDNIRRGSVGDFSVYAEVVAADRNVVMSIVCAGKSAVQLSVVANQPIATLRPLLDELGASFVGAR
jgi:hypothetical protein